MYQLEWITLPKSSGVVRQGKKGATESIVMPSSTSLFQVTHFFDTLEVDLVSKSYTCKN